VRLLFKATDFEFIGFLRCVYFGVITGLACRRLKFGFALVLRDVSEKFFFIIYYCSV
jgi:hypothetical protein